MTITGNYITDCVIVSRAVCTHMRRESLLCCCESTAADDVERCSRRDIHTGSRPQRAGRRPGPCRCRRSSAGTSRRSTGRRCRRSPGESD